MCIVVYLIVVKAFDQIKHDISLQKMFYQLL